MLRQRAVFGTDAEIQLIAIREATTCWPKPTAVTASSPSCWIVGSNGLALFRINDGGITGRTRPAAIDGRNVLVSSTTTAVNTVTGNVGISSSTITNSRVFFGAVIETLASA